MGSSRPPSHHHSYSRIPRTTFINIGRGYSPGPNWGGAPNNNSPRNNNDPKTSVITVIIVVAFIAIVLLMLSGGGSTSYSTTEITKNTTERTALAGVVNKTDWYRDDIGWISDKSDLISGLEHFYNKTGVQPYLLLIPYSDQLWSGSDLNSTAAEQYLDAFYEQNFTDEGHFILAYFQCERDSKSEVNGEFRYWYGYAVNSIMDTEAQDIMEGYHFQNYDDLSLSFEEMISETFSETADSIMSKPTNGWDFAKFAVIPLVIAIVAVCGFYGYKLFVKRRREKEEYVKDILDQPLETFGTDTSELEEKYK